MEHSTQQYSVKPSLPVELQLEVFRQMTQHELNHQIWKGIMDSVYTIPHPWFAELAREMPGRLHSTVCASTKHQ